MGVYLRGAWYWYRRTIQGRVFQLPLRIHKGQEALLSARVKQVDDQLTARTLGLPAPAGGNMLFSDYCAAYLKRKAYAKTVVRMAERLSIVANLWPDLPLAHYTPAHVRELEEKLFSKGLKPATVNRYAELLRNLWACAIEDREATENPWRQYKPYAEDGVRRALTDAEVTAILAEAARRQAHPRATVDPILPDLIMFALATGLRLSEILNLRRDRVAGNVLRVGVTETKGKRRGVSRTGQREKNIALSPLAVDIINHQPARDGYVFDVSWRKANVMGRVIRSMRRVTGIADWTFHSFRHTASTFIAEHSSLATAKAQMGHASLTTTLRYTHPGEREKLMAVTKLGTHISNLSRKSLKEKDS